MNDRRPIRAESCRSCCRVVGKLGTPVALVRWFPVMTSFSDQGLGMCVDCVFHLIMEHMTS